MHIRYQMTSKIYQLNVYQVKERLHTKGLYQLCEINTVVSSRIKLDLTYQSIISNTTFMHT